MEKAPLAYYLKPIIKGPKDYAKRMGILKIVSLKKIKTEKEEQEYLIIEIW